MILSMDEHAYIVKGEGPRGICVRSRGPYTAQIQYAAPIGREHDATAPDNRRIFTVPTIAIYDLREDAIAAAVAFKAGERPFAIASGVYYSPEPEPE
jgi:hypothetical protein